MHDPENFTANQSLKSEKIINLVNKELLSKNRFFFFRNAYILIGVRFDKNDPSGKVLRSQNHTLY